MLTRDQAWELLCAWTPSERLRVHALAVEGVMQDLARTVHAPEEQWGLAGLLHDADYDQWPETHPHRIVTWLAEQDEPDLAYAISAHYTAWGHPVKSPLDAALLGSDEITGMVMATALVRPQRTEGLEPKSVLKKLKTPGFAAGVNRNEVEAGFQALQTHFGGSVEDHLVRIIASLHARRSSLGLVGGPA